MNKRAQPTWVTGAAPSYELYLEIQALALRRDHPKLDLPDGLTAPQRSLVAVLRFYQRYLSRRVGRKCVFEPSCSSYAVLAVASNGVKAGGREALDRWRRCRPVSAGGPDYPRGCDVSH
jgi:putative membrane protein insertion efficiency factor